MFLFLLLKWRNTIKLCHITCSTASLLARCFLSGDDVKNKSRLDKGHSSGKKKKKKRRRKDGGSSESGAECASPPRDVKGAPSSPPKLIEDLPDIIPKQVKTRKNESKTKVQCYVMCKYSLMDLNDWGAVECTVYATGAL